VGARWALLRIDLFEKGLVSGECRVSSPCRRPAGSERPNHQFSCLWACRRGETS
jgi:hypothetical protein